MKFHILHLTKPLLYAIKLLLYAILTLLFCIAVLVILVVTVFTDKISKIFGSKKTKLPATYYQITSWDSD